MISLTFETKRFRVQITGKTVWVESSEGAGWIFRNQHSLPVPPEALRGRSDSSVLRAAVQHFERTNGGDSSLREALTGIREAKPLPPVAPSIVKPPVDPANGFHGRAASNRFRLPLRPPIATQE